MFSIFPKWIFWINLFIYNEIDLTSNSIFLVICNWTSAVSNYNYSGESVIILICFCSFIRQTPCCSNVWSNLYRAYSAFQAADVSHPFFQVICCMSWRFVFSKFTVILRMVQGLGIEWRFMILRVRDAVFFKLSVYIPPVKNTASPISWYSAQRVLHSNNGFHWGCAAKTFSISCE